MPTAPFDRIIKIPGRGKPTLLINGRSDIRVHQDLVQEAWQRANLDEAHRPGNHLYVAVNMHRAIGQTSVVNAQAIDPRQEAWFSRKRYRRYVSRVVRAKGLPDTRYLTLICDRIDSDWLLRRVEMGAFIAPEPLDFAAIARHGAVLSSVVHFWSRHAHVYQPGHFSTSPQRDCWVRVLATAQQKHSVDLLNQVGFFDFARAHNISSHPEHAETP